MANIRNLVFSGGGVSAFSYGGALEALIQQPDFSLAQIERVIGTSAGAIAAFQVAANFTVQQMLENRKCFDCNKIADTSSIFKIGYNLLYFFAIYQGNELRKSLLSLIKVAGLNEKSTFGDLKKKGFKDLYITTSQIKYHEDKPQLVEKIFSAEEDEDTPILPVLVASASIPGVFPAVRLKQCTATCWIEDPEGERFIDGGCTNNFPIEHFDDPKYRKTLEFDHEDKIVPNHETLGLRISSPEEMSVIETYRYSTTQASNGNLIEDSLAALYHAMQPDYNNEKNGYRTIFINRHHISATQFGITEKEKELLHQSGKEAVLNKLHYDQKVRKYYRRLSMFFRDEVLPLATSSRATEPIHPSMQ